MSRSRKKRPHFRYCGESDKKEKRLANRKFRRIGKCKLKLGKEPPADKRENSDIYWFLSDGKHYCINPNSEWMRK